MMWDKLWLPLCNCGRASCPDANIFVSMTRSKDIVLIADNSEGNGALRADMDSLAGCCCGICDVLERHVEAMLADRRQVDNQQDAGLYSMPWQEDPPAMLETFVVVDVILVDPGGEAELVATYVAYVPASPPPPPRVEASHVLDEYIGELGLGLWVNDVAKTPFEDYVLQGEAPIGSLSDDDREGWGRIIF